MLLGAAIAACAGVAHAADAALEEIVVTAVRQKISTFATPLSISRIGDETIELLGATHSSEVLNRVPGALVQRGSGQESLTAIRSPVVTGAGSCGAFLFLENGVPIRPVGFCNVNEMLGDQHRAGGCDRSDPWYGHRAVRIQCRARHRQRVAGHARAVTGSAARPRGRSDQLRTHQGEWNHRERLHRIRRQGPLHARRRLA